MHKQINELCTKVKEACKKNWIYIVLFLILVVALISVIAAVIIEFHKQKQFIYWVTNNTGSVADWIGNVSVPIILALFTFKYRTQEMHTRIQNEKDKVFGLKLDLNRIYSHLQLAYEQQKLLIFQRELNKYIEDLREMREKILYFNDHTTSKPLYSELGDLIDSGNNIKNFNQVEECMKTLQAVDDALRKYYQHIQ